MIGRLKRVARSAASSLVHLALRSARLRALVSADLKARRPPPPVDAVVPAGAFIDRFGVSHPLDLGLRDRLKPGWRIMCDEASSSLPPTDDAMRIRAVKAERSVAEAAALVATAAGRALSGRVLEIGCYDGSVAFQLAKRDGMEVVASDMARYYVVQRPGDPDPTDLGGQQDELARLRERARVAADADLGSVRFVEDDITSSSLEPGTFDAVVSFEVLEHVQDPTEAFASMARLLKPGGVGYHDYNPFFSLIGGHSLCTLDFAWGHARLDGEDFERYLQENRAAASAQTLRFYRESLNRMSLADLRLAIASAGLECLDVVPWSDRTLVGQLTPDVLTQVRRAYPTVTLQDLLSTFVAVVVRRPSS